jgi:hypothetical protein
MLLIEGVIIILVLLYAASYAIKEPKPKVFLKKYLSCAMAAWMAEESCILLYGVYAYNPVWNLVIADVPLVVFIVWPAIIHSATVLASYVLKAGSNLMPLITGCIVLTDALFIEPISVNFNLWTWYLPGVFGVPLIGFLGWAYFAFFAAAFFVPIDRLSQRKLNLPILLLVTVIGTHLFLLISYWGLFRWATLSINPAFSAGAVWIMSALISFLLVFTKVGYRVELKTLMNRLPAAIFFYLLLFLKRNSPMPLIVYSLAFIPPYLSMLVGFNITNKPFRGSTK